MGHSKENPWFLLSEKSLHLSRKPVKSFLAPCLSNVWKKKCPGSIPFPMAFKVILEGEEGSVRVELNRCDFSGKLTFEWVSSRPSGHKVGSHGLGVKRSPT